MDHLRTPAYNTRSKAIGSNVLEKEDVPLSEAETITGPMGHSTHIHEESITESEDSDMSPGTHLNSVRQEIAEQIETCDREEVVNNIGDKTIHWEFLESIEPPRVAHVRCVDVIHKENIFAQITVRFHTQQKLVVYDRFGRLLHGNKTLPKDVLEYVVFEKHIVNKYGRWRVHDKIIPDWMPSRPAPLRTHVIHPEPEPEPDSQVEPSTVVAETAPTTPAAIAP